MTNRKNSTPQTLNLPLTDNQLLRSIYVVAMLALLLPPLLGGTLMGLVGFYPLPEFYQIFFSYSGPYILTVMVAVLVLVPHVYRYINSLTQIDPELARKKTLYIFSRLPWTLLIFITLYSMGGAYSADVSLESMGVRNYTTRDHLYNQFGIIPVVLITVFPIFFFLVDRLGRYLGPRGIVITAIPLWVKLLMLGIITPLLIDTLLIGYYYNRTGFFRLETLILWFSLILLAMGGTWFAWRSLRQGLAPLEAFINSLNDTDSTLSHIDLMPLSLDELGVLTARYANLISSQHLLSLNLQYSQKLAESIIDKAGALVIVLDNEGRIIRFNDACEKASGFSFAEVEGKFPWDTVLPPEEADMIRENAFEILANAPKTLSGHYVNYWVTKNNERVLIEWDNTVLLNNQGHTENIISVGIDISERSKIEQKLRDQATIIDQIHDSVIRTDLQGNITSWNKGAERIFGFTESEMQGQPIAKVYPLEQQHVLTDEVIAPLIQKGTHTCTVIMLRKNGEKFHGHLSLSLQYNTEHQPIGMIGYTIDVTDQILAEETLKESEAMLNKAQHMAKLGSWELDLLNNKLHWSDEIFNIFEINKTHFAASYEAFLEGIHPEDRDMVNLAYTESLKDRKPYEIIHRLKMKDGRIKYVRESCESYFAEDGTPLRSVGTVQDITQLHIIEMELLHHQEHLEDLVKVRTNELILARDQAEYANNAKSTFLSRMSHELRTPLNAIIGFGQLLEIDTDHPLDRVQAQNFQEIMNASNHLLELVNEILDLSRIESGRLELNLEPVRVSPVISSCINQLKPLAAKRSINIDIDLNATCVVMADEMRLKEVLLNLISNAIKYNRENGNIKLTCSAGTNNSMRISVIDTGRGISEDSLLRLFKPFERLESAYEGIEGSGIGLALVKHLVEGMHGTIGVESTVNKGSIFWFELPISMDEARYKPEITDSSVTPDSKKMKADNIKVLYIEDNPSNMRLMKALFEQQENIILLEAKSAEDGLEVAFNQFPDLILLDINLPGMDGFQALGKIQSNPESKNIPVVAVTANAMSKDIDRIKSSGFVDYLIKPVDIKKLFNLLEDYF